MEKEIQKAEQKEEQLRNLMAAMIRYDRGDPKRIQHFTKVHSYARLIGFQEHLDQETVFILEAAALVHDIGIKNAEKKFGKCDGKLQEQEGPGEAGKMLSRLQFSPEETERVKYLVGHHHTYEGIDGPDYQILVEADFLVNLYEDGLDWQAALSVKKKIFKTASGIQILDEMFDL